MAKTTPDSQQQDENKAITPEQAKEMEEWYQKDLPSTKKNSDDEDKNGLSPEKLDDSEKSAASIQHDNQVGDGYKGSSKNNNSRLRSRVFKTRRRTILIGAALATLLVTISALIFFSLLPLKILHIVNNLQNRFYATSQNALSKETDKLFSDYIRKKIKLGGCTAKRIDSTCNPFTAGDSLVTRLYRGWSNGRLEDKLWDDYGIGITKNPRSQSGYELEYRQTGILLLNNNFLDGSATLDDILRTEGSFTPTSRNQIRQAFLAAFEKETRTKKIMYYIKVSKLLERKYGIKFCTIGCPKTYAEIVNNVRDWKDNKKRAAKMFLAQRVLFPKYEIYNLLYECLLSDNCAPEDFTNLSASDYQAAKTGCTTGCDLNGEVQTQADRDVRKKVLISRLLTAYGGDVVSLINDYNVFKNGGILGLLQKRSKVLTRDGGTARGQFAQGLIDRTAALKASNAVPVIGQVNMAFSLIHNAKAMAVAVPKMVYIMNSTAAATFFAMYRTHADEIKEGKVDAAVVGSFTDSLGPGVQIDSNANDQVGGLAEAENTPLYGTIIGNTQTQTKFASVLSNILSPKAYAVSSPYVCAEPANSPVPAGKLVCDEEKIHQDGNQISKGLLAITTSGFWSTLDQAARVWINVRNNVFSGIGALASAICNPVNIFGIPINPISVICKLAESAASSVASLIGPWLNNNVLEPAIRFVLEHIFGFNINMISNHMSGGRAFDMLAGGADVSGNDFSHNGIGGRILSSSEVSQITKEESDKRLAHYKSETFFGQMFDKDSEYSPVSKLAMSLPTNKDVIMRPGLASIAAKPFSIISRFFGALFSLGHARAAAAAQVVADPFGIAQYGYPVDDPVFKEDPEEYWNNHCITSSDPNNLSLTELYNKYATEHWDDTWTGINTVPDTSTSTGSKLSQISPTGTNGCLLIQATVGSAGAIFTDDVLSPQELTLMKPLKAMLANDQDSSLPAFATGVTP